MGKKDKLIERLKAKPRDFTFKNPNHKTIMLHKLHPRKELLEYQVKELIRTLEEEGLL